MSNNYIFFINSNYENKIKYCILIYIGIIDIFWIFINSNKGDYF